MRGMQKGWVPATVEEKGHDQCMRGPDFGSIPVETREKKLQQYHSFFPGCLFDSLSPFSLLNPNIILGGEIMLAFKLNADSKWDIERKEYLVLKSCHTLLHKLG